MPEKLCGECRNWGRLAEYVTNDKGLGCCWKRHQDMLGCVIRTGRSSAYDIEYALFREDTTASETDCEDWEVRE